MTDWAPPPFRIAFDTARDPYTARNALGITNTVGPPGPTGPAGPTGPTGPAGVVTATPPLVLTGSTLSISVGTNLTVTGGALTTAANLTATSITLSPAAGNPGVVVKAPAGANNATYSMQDSAGNLKGAVYWENSNNATALYQASSGQSLYLHSNGQVTAGLGLTCRAGTGGVTGANAFNLFWTGSAFQLWADTFNSGLITVSCDYRIKKDIENLPSTWEAVKALRPIKYTQAAYPVATKDTASLFVADDIERWGFIAHELQETLIQTAANGIKDQENLIQSPNWLPVVAALTKALQEAMARIEALEAKP